LDAKRGVIPRRSAAESVELKFVAAPTDILD